MESRAHPGSLQLNLISTGCIQPCPSWGADNSPPQNSGEMDRAHILSQAHTVLQTKHQGRKQSSKHQGNERDFLPFSRVTNVQRFLSSPHPTIPPGPCVLCEAQLKQPFPEGQDTLDVGLVEHGGAWLHPSIPWSVLPSQGRVMGLPASTGSAGSLGTARAPRSLALVRPHCPPDLTCAQVLAELPGAFGTVPAPSLSLHTTATLHKHSQQALLISQSPSELQVFLP